MKFLSLLLLACFLAAPAVHAQMAGILKPGDSVVIQLKTPAEDAENVTTTYAVSDRGTIKLPMLEQEVSAAGVTASTLARRIEAAYKENEIYTAPMINVTLPTVSEGGMVNHVVNVGGEVRASGEFPLRQGMRLLQAINRAGGFTEFAKTKGVKLIRGNREMIFDMRKINADGSNNPVLMDGDQIIVPGG
jgi:protein involved in polysaccharide export with SLBB domain